MSSKKNKLNTQQPKDNVQTEVANTELATESATNAPSAVVVNTEGGETTTPVETVKTAVEVVTVPTEPVVDTVFSFLNAKYNNMAFSQENVTGVLRIVLNRIESYSQSMGSKTPVTPETIVNNQLSLLQTFLTALDAKGDDSHICLDAICYYFNKNETGAFSERLVFRDINRLGLNSASRSILENLTTLFLNTSNLNKRRVFLSRNPLNRYIANLSPEYAANLVRFLQS